MAYFVNTEAGTLAERTEIAPSAGLSFAGAVGSAVTGNISSVIADYGELQQANQGPRLSKQDSEKLATDAGVKLKVPDDGYTQSALDILIKRKRNEALRQRVDEATPWSWAGSPIRGGAMLLAGVADPLNVASAFVPVVGQARTASMLARAGESAFARAATRTGIGAAEGAVGAAIVEVPTYFGRTSLQDDYGLTDSLINMTFGTALGGGLHAVGGAVGDSLRGGVNPYARFAGMDAPSVRAVMEFEAGRRSADGLTTAQRRAAGIADVEIDMLPAAPTSTMEAQPVRSQLPAAELAQVSDAPFAKLYERTPDSARADAVRELMPELRAELLSVAGNRAASQEIPALKAELQQAKDKLEQLDSEAEFKARAKAHQKQGLSRKEAESAARKSLAEDRADVVATSDRIAQQIDTNAKASQAEQEIAALDKGEVPQRFADRVDTLTADMLGAAEMARAITGRQEPPAAFLVGMAQPETREAVMRAAIAHMADGRLPDVDAVLRTDPGLIGVRTTPQDVKRAAERQAQPDSAALGDPKAAEAATVRQHDAHKQFTDQGLSDELTQAMDQLAALQRNLKAAGLEKSTVDKLGDLSAFTEAVKQADAIGRGLEAAALCGVRQ